MRWPATGVKLTSATWEGEAEVVFAFRACGCAARAAEEAGIADFFEEEDVVAGFLVEAPDEPVASSDVVGQVPVAFTVEFADVMC